MVHHTTGRQHHMKTKMPNTPYARRVDKVIGVIGVLAPTMNLPQAWQIYAYKDASGVSLLSWASFACFSVVWVMYGMLHKDKHIVTMFSLLFIVQASIAVGTILY